MQSVFKELRGLQKSETDQVLQKDLLKINQDLHKQHLLPYFEIIEEAADPKTNPDGFDLKNLSTPQPAPPVPPLMESTPPGGNFNGSGSGEGGSGGGSDGGSDDGDGNGTANGSGGGDVSSISDPGGDTWDGVSQGDMPLSGLSAKNLGQQLWAETPWASFCDNANEGCAASVSKVLEDAGISYAASPGVLALSDQLTSHGWSKSSGVDTAQPGDVIYGNNGGSDQHVGIVGLDRGQLVLYNNWSSDGKWHEEPLKSFYIATHFKDNVTVLHPPPELATHVAAKAAATAPTAAPAPVGKHS
jgi:hypothetical protein